jgi:hypothetical protein
VCKILLSFLLVGRALVAQAVEGEVTSMGGSALAGVSVTLVKAGDRNEVTEYSAATDASGSFRLMGVKDGVYVVHLDRAGFLSPSPGGPGNRPFAVEGGVPTRHLRFEMLPEGKVSGRIVDGRGAPVPGAGVTLAVPNGLYQQDTASADGNFAFNEVSPGTYTLLAVAPPGWKPPDPVDGQELAWVPTFLGGVSFRDGAARIAVRPGSDISDQKVKLLAAPIHRLHGEALGPSGNAAAGAKVEIWKEDGEESQSTVSKPDGSFGFAITDGRWRLSAELGSNPTKLAGSLNGQVSGADLDVVLRLSMPFSVHGVVLFDPPHDGASTLSILFTPAGGSGMPAVAKVDELGNFAADGFYTGAYGITMAPPVPAMGYFLDAIRIGDRETLTREVEIVSEYAPILVRFKAGGGTVQGSVEDCGGATVLLLPQDKSIRRQGVVRSARCSEGDAFEISSIRPGDYYVFAFASGSAPLIPPYDLDQDQLNSAVKLTVADRSNSKIDLKVSSPSWY